MADYRTDVNRFSGRNGATAGYKAGQFYLMLRKRCYPANNDYTYSAGAECVSCKQRLPMKNFMKKLLKKLWSNLIVLLVIFLAFDAVHGGRHTTAAWLQITGKKEAGAPQAAGKSNQAVLDALVAVPDETPSGQTPEIVPEDAFMTSEFWRTASPEDVLLKLKNGADAGQRNPAGRTILMYAASLTPDPQILEILLQNGADIRSRDEYGRTALMFAAGVNANPQTAEILLRHGADVKERDKLGWTPLMYAAAYNPSAAMAQTLIDYGAEVNARVKRDNPMKKATLTNNFISTVKIAFESAGELFERLYGLIGDEKTPGTSSVVTVVNSTIDNMAAKIVNPEEMMTPLILAGRSSPSPEVLKTLLANGALVKAYDEKGKTAVDYAKENPAVFNTDVYWEMNDMLYR